MRLDSVRLRNIGALKEASIDFADLGDARLLAVVGGNGAGKSSFLEVAAVGALYRTTPTRGSLLSLATARDSYVEVQVTNGQTYRIKHLLDNIGGKSEASVTDAEGRPLFDSAKVRDFGTWAAKALPAPEVTLATVFAAQNSSGFLGAKPSERKSILLRALGIEALEGLAKRAREHRSEVAAQVETLRARLDDERGRGGDVGALERDLQAATQRDMDSASAVTSTRAALETARAAAAESARARRDYEATVERRVKLQAELQQELAQLADVDRRLANNRAVLAEGDSIRAAAAAVDGKRSKLAELHAAEEGLRAQVSALSTRERELRGRFAEANHRRAQAEQRIAEGEEARGAAKRLPDVEAQLAAAEQAATAAREQLDELQGEGMAGADERIVGLRLGLESIAESTLLDFDHHLAARNTLNSDDAAVARARAFPERLTAAKAEVARAAMAREKIQGECTLLRIKAGRLNAVEQATADLEAARQELATIDAAQAETAVKLSTARQDIAAIEEHSNRLRRDISDLESVASKLTPLQNAEARLAELDPQHTGLETRIQALKTELTDTPEPPLPPAAPDVSAFHQQVDFAEQEQRVARERVVLLESQLAAARESAERSQVLEAELARASDELADWTRLAEDLGPKGLQLTLIDSAGPEITDAANELLRECHGPRFTVRVETQRLSSDKKKLLDGCDVIVTDSENGREASGETFSGGERVIIGEALSLALTVVACRRSGVQGVTLIRDETAGQLSPENARAYLGMLRRASDMVGASRVLFVAHDPSLWEMADAVIEVAGGRVVVK